MNVTVKTILISLSLLSCTEDRPTNPDKIPPSSYNEPPATAGKTTTTSTAPSNIAYTPDATAQLPDTLKGTWIQYCQPIVPTGALTAKTFVASIYSEADSTGKSVSILEKQILSYSSGTVCDNSTLTTIVKTKDIIDASSFTLLANDTYELNLTHYTQHQAVFVAEHVETRISDATCKTSNWRLSSVSGNEYNWVDISGCYSETASQKLFTIYKLSPTSTFASLNSASGEKQFEDLYLTFGDIDNSHSGINAEGRHASFDTITYQKKKN